MSRALPERSFSERSSSGRRAALAGLYREHRSALRSFLFALLRNGTEADDALQEVFLQLLERWESIDPNKAKSWLFKVAYTTAMGVHRRNGRDQRAVSKLRERPVWESDRESVEAPHKIIQLEAAREVRAAIARLPVEQQDVVRRRMYDGKTFKIIAQELGCPIGTVLTRMRLAVSRLRNWIQE